VRIDVKSGKITISIGVILMFFVFFVSTLCQDYAVMNLPFCVYIFLRTFSELLSMKTQISETCFCGGVDAGTSAGDSFVNIISHEGINVELLNLKIFIIDLKVTYVVSTSVTL